MIKKLSLLVLVSFFICGALQLAHASPILINFNAPNFALETIDTNHAYNTAYGTMNFNGLISNNLGGIVLIDPLEPDYFLRNSAGHDQLTINFSFDVLYFDILLMGKAGSLFQGEARDINGTPITSQIWMGNYGWSKTAGFGLPKPIRSIAVWSLFGDGDNVAVDELNLDNFGITPVVPEPASMSLLGLGLLGLCKFKRKV